MEGYVWLYIILVVIFCCLVAFLILWRCFGIAVFCCGLCCGPRRAAPPCAVAQMEMGMQQQQAAFAMQGQGPPMQPPMQAQAMQGQPVAQDYTMPNSNATPVAQDYTMPNSNNKKNIN